MFLERQMQSIYRIGRTLEELNADEDGVLAEEEWCYVEEEIMYRRQELIGELNLWPHVPGSSTGSVMISELMWTLAAASLLHHLLSHDLSAAPLTGKPMEESAFRKALQAHSQVVEAYCKLLGIAPSSLTAVCNMANDDGTRHFEVPALLTALIQLGQSSEISFIVTVELSPPSDSDDVEAFRIHVSSMGGEVKEIRFVGFDVPLEYVKEQIQEAFAVDTQRCIELLTVSGTMLSNNDKLPQALKQCQHDEPSTAVMKQSPASMAEDLV